MEAECAVTTNTIEMGVLVFQRAIVMALAHLIFCNACSVLDGVNEMICQKQG